MKTINFETTAYGSLNFETLAYRMPAFSTDETDSTVTFIDTGLSRDDLCRVFDRISSTGMNVANMATALEQASDFSAH